MTEKHVTSLQLSKQLKEAGYPQESEFYWVITLTTNYHLSWYPNGVLPKHLKERNDCYSAPLATELGEWLPIAINIPYKNGKPRQYNHYCRWGRYKIDNNPYWCGFFNSGYSNIGMSERADTEANSRAKMILYLVKEGIISFDKKK